MMVRNAYGVEILLSVGEIRRLGKGRKGGVGPFEGCVITGFQVAPDLRVLLRMDDGGFRTALPEELLTEEEWERKPDLKGGRRKPLPQSALTPKREREEESE